MPLVIVDFDTGKAEVVADPNVSPELQEYAKKASEKAGATPVENK